MLSVYLYVSYHHSLVSSDSDCSLCCLYDYYLLALGGGSMAILNNVHLCSKDATSNGHTGGNNGEVVPCEIEGTHVYPFAVEDRPPK